MHVLRLGACVGICVCAFVYAFVYSFVHVHLCVHAHWCVHVHAQGPPHLRRLGEDVRAWRIGDSSLCVWGGVYVCVSV